MALWQAERVQALLKKTRPEVSVEIEIIHTSGDKILDKPLVQIGGKGIFTKEIEDALLREDIDFAVHSFKDLPTVLPDGLEIIAIPERDNPFDALFSKTASSLANLPKNPTIATGSLRRKSQVLALRPDTTVVDIRGNVNTRLRKYRESEWDGLIMAMAGIRRMGWEDQIAGLLNPDEMLPAPAQGALAVEARNDDEATYALLNSIHDKETAAGVKAERAFLASLEGGCQVPIAAYAESTGDSKIKLTGLVASLDGRDCIRESLEDISEKAEEIGNTLAQRVYENGGQKIIEALKAKNNPPF